MGQAVSNMTMAEILSARGEHEAAISLAREAVAFWRSIHQNQIVPQALGSLAVALEAGGKRTQAIEVSEERLRLARANNQEGQAALALLRLGICMVRDLDYVRGTAYLRESLLSFRRVGNRRQIAQAFDFLGNAAVGCGNHSRAVRFFGVADSMRESLGVSASPAVRLDAERIRGLAMDKLGGSQFSAYLAEGRAMTSDEAIDMAFEDE
jgi:tetratricopeptide (TPR) repeat protein